MEDKNLQSQGLSKLPELTGLVENPQKLMENAHLVADAFNKIISKQGMFTDIQGKRHIHADGWSMLGILLGVFPDIISTERIECGKFTAVKVERINRYNKKYYVWSDKDRVNQSDNIVEEREKEEIKYKSIVALNTLAGKKLAQISVLCSNREDGKVDNDEYAIESMAQTRGIGKVYRSAFGWVAKMAGYEATPFEEAEGIYSKDESVKPMATQETMQRLTTLIENSKNQEEYSAAVEAISKNSSELNPADIAILRRVAKIKLAEIKGENPAKVAPEQKEDEPAKVEEVAPEVTPKSTVADPETGEVVEAPEVEAEEVVEPPKELEDTPVNRAAAAFDRQRAEKLKAEQSQIEVPEDNTPQS